MSRVGADSGDRHNDQTDDPCLAECSFRVGDHFNVNFGLKSEVVHDFIGDLTKLFSKYHAQMNLGMTPSPKKRPRKTRIDGDMVIIRKTLTDLLDKGLIPDKLAEELKISSRGLQPNKTQYVFWRLVDLGYIPSLIKRPSKMSPEIVAQKLSEYGI